MATRVYHASGNSEGNTAVTSDSVYGDHRVLTFTPDASSTYVILAYCETQTNTATIDTQVRLWDATASASIDSTNVEMAVGTSVEWPPVTLMAIMTFGGSPSSQTVKIQHKMETASGGVESRCRNGTIVALKLGADDVTAFNNTAHNSTADSTAWTDYNDTGAGNDALVFTPPSTGDYLIIAQARFSSSATNADGRLRMLCEDGTTAVGYIEHRQHETVNTRTWGATVLRTGLTAAAHTFKLQHGRLIDGIGTQTINSWRMVGLRMSGFDDNDHTQDVVADTTGSTTWVDIGDTHTQTLDSVDYLLLSSFVLTAPQSTSNADLKLTDGTNTFAEVSFRPATNSKRVAALIPRLVAGAGASTTHKYQAQIATAATLTLNEHRFHMLQVEASAGGEVTGTVAETLDNATSAASGASGASGTVAETLDDATSTASGSSTTGTVVETLADTTAATSGGVGASGSLAETLDDATSAADGTHSTAGTVAVTLADATSAADATHSTTGTSAVTLGAVTCAADGTADAPPGGIEGTANVTLAETSVVAAGGHGTSGDLTETLDDVTSTAAGTYTADFTGTLTETLADLTCVASGNFTVTVPPDLYPALVTVRQQRFTKRLRFHRNAERPTLHVWVRDARDELVDLSDPSYTFAFRIGIPGYQAVLDKTTNITGATGSGSEGDGTPNVTIGWEPGELDIAPGVYNCELVATTTSLDLVYHGNLEIINTIL